LRFRAVCGLDEGHSASRVPATPRAVVAPATAGPCLESHLRAELGRYLESSQDRISGLAGTQFQLHDVVRRK
jgi:hypothetical protein